MYLPVSTIDTGRISTFSIELVACILCNVANQKQIKKHYQAYKATINTKSKEVALLYANIIRVKVFKNRIT